VSTYELIKELKQKDFADETTWMAILDHPKLRPHLSLRASAMMEMFPNFKPYRSS
jgi:hypothetical protein